MPLSHFLTVVDPAAAAPVPEDMAIQYPYPLDPFQRHAVAAIHRGENVLVTAKTGSGKTLVGEYQIAYSLRAGRRVFYTTPIKSLSNQKFYDLKKIFPGRVGIMTGDIKYKPDADIVIMTTEILRNLLYKRGTATEHLGLTASLSLDGLDAVVFDECHYINDRDRGSVWEETLILLPPSVRLILLSATIDQPEQFASWLGDLKQVPIHLISTQYRIVPLVHGVYRGDELLTFMDAKDHFETGTYKAWLLWRQGQKDGAAAHRAAVAARRANGYEDGPVKRTGGLKSFVHELNAMVARLEAKELLPALTFVFSRKDCERYARLVEHTLLDSSDAATVAHIIDFHLHRYKEELERIPQMDALRSLLLKGIAFHHSGLLPILKEIVEILFSRGYVKLLFATETFAVGINMPTKTVLFTSFRKYDDSRGGLRLLNTDEYIQMAGRAGRRGKDDKGLVLYLPDREPEDADDMRRMCTGARSTFQSRMTFHYDFLLKTLGSANLRWLDIMQTSYWFQRHAQVVAHARAEEERLVAAVAALGLSDADRAAMEEWEGLVTAVGASVNAARRQAQRALETWSNTHIGPRWYALQKETWPRWKRLQKELDAVRSDLAAMEVPQASVEPTLEVLRRLGFLGDAAALTSLGTMATEVNEGHTILMPLFYTRCAAARAALKTPEEVLAFLALYLGEARLDEQPAPVETLQVPESVRAACRAAVRLGKECQETETAVGATAPPSPTYWELNWGWVEPVWRWLGGASLAELAAETGMFEGSLVREFLKLGNLLEEWRILATLSEDLEMLELLRGAEARIRVGVAATDSLYLRLD